MNRVNGDMKANASLLHPTHTNQKQLPNTLCIWFFQQIFIPQASEHVAILLTSCCGAWLYVHTTVFHIDNFAGKLHQ